MNKFSNNSCDKCHNRVEELKPMFIAGVDFMLCYDCYEQTAVSGLYDY